MPATAESAARSLHVRKIGNQQLVLIVDDDEAARDVVVEEVTALGYEAIVAANGFEAIREAALYKPGVVVVRGLGFNLHGIEISRFLRAAQATYAPRIIVMPATEHRGDGRESPERSIGHFLARPVPPDVRSAAPLEC